MNSVLLYQSSSKFGTDPVLLNPAVLAQYTGVSFSFLFMAWYLKIQFQHMHILSGKNTN